MNQEEKLLKIINNYGVMPQLKYFQSEVFELNEAIIRYEEFDRHIGNLAIYDTDETELKKENITEEIADVMVMLMQFKLYYGITSEEIKNIFWSKVDRQLERIKNNL